MTTETDTYYLDLMKKAAEEVSPVSHQKIHACIVIKNRIISFGMNKYKTHPLQKKFGGENKIYLHAEISAIINALKCCDVSDLERSTLYVARVKRPSAKSRAWVSGLAKPCEGCAKCIAAFNIKKVVYSENLVN